MRYITFEISPHERALKIQREELKALQQEEYLARAEGNGKKVVELSKKVAKLVPVVTPNSILGDLEVFQTMLDLLPLTGGQDSRRYHNVCTACDKVELAGVLELSDDDYKWLKEKLEKLDLSGTFKDASGNPQPVYGTALKKAICRLQVLVDEASPKRPE